MRRLDLLVVNWQDRLNPRSGGAETHLHEIFRRLVQRGHAVTLLTSGWANAPRRELVDGIDVHRVGNRHTFPLAAPTYYRRSMSGTRFDLLIEDLNKVPLFSPWWARSPVVLVAHHLFGLAAFRSASPVVAGATVALERLIPLVYRDVRIHAVSKGTASELMSLGISPERVAVIHNGVDAARLTPGPRGSRSATPLFVYLGRLERYKRVDLLLAAAATLRRQGHEVRLLIAGRGREARSLRARSEALGIANVVEFAGFVSEERKVEMLRAAWANVFTSTKEGWGIGALEAGACGTPTIASDVPGLRESVIDRKTGLLVRHGGVEALADAMRFLILYPEYAEQLGAQARRFAEKFSWDDAADRTEADLRALVCAAALAPAAAHSRGVGGSRRPAEIGRD